MDKLESDPVIVYGAPRSGTTYLTTLLNSHPEVFVSNEIRLFAWLHQTINVVPLDVRNVMNSRSEFVNHLRVAFPELVREFYRKMHPGARYWGDKNPHYAAPRNQGCLDTIAELFPGSRFI